MTTMRPLGVLTASPSAPSIAAVCRLPAVLRARNRGEKDDFSELVEQGRRCLRGLRVLGLLSFSGDDATPLKIYWYTSTATASIFSSVGRSPWKLHPVWLTLRLLVHFSSLSC